MKLAYSPASPYVRKVNACAIARGIDKQIERWKVGTTDPALLEFNPLSKVPTLITDDGARLYDSPVICEYLDSVGSAPKLFPAAGPARPQISPGTTTCATAAASATSSSTTARRPAPAPTASAADKSPAASAPDRAW
jgi:glutathione S-transferase